MAANAELPRDIPVPYDGGELRGAPRPATLDVPLPAFLAALSATSMGVLTDPGGITDPAAWARRLPDLARAKAAAARAGRIVDVGEISGSTKRMGEDTGRALGLLADKLIQWPWGALPWLVIMRASDPDIHLAPQRWAGLIVPSGASGPPTIHALTPTGDPGVLGIAGTARFGEVPEFGDEGVLHALAVISLAAVAWLNTRGAPVESLPPKLRGRRARPGLRRLPTGWWTLLVRRERGTREGGTHASPVAHHRRGHLRELGDGRRVWVRDCIVGGKDEGQLAFTERHRAGIRLDGRKP